MRPHRLITVIPAVLATIVACSDTPPVEPKPRAAVRDSAGVLLVEIGDPYSYSLPEAELRETWTTTPDALLSRVVGGVILDGSRAAIVDQGNTEILLLGSDGSVAQKVGRVGDGPEEYRFPTSIHPVGDELWVHDARLARWTRLDEQLDLVSTQPSGLESYVVELRPLTVASTGTVAAIYGDMRRFGTDGVSRDTMPLLLIDSVGRADTLGVWANQEWAYARIEGGASRAPVGYGRTTLAAGGEKAFALGDNATWNVHVFDDQGRVVRVIRIGASPVEISPEEAERYRVERQEALPLDASDSYRERVAAAPVSETYPTYEDLEVANDGTVWIGLTVRVGETIRRWIEVTPEGEIGHEFELPPDTDVLAITRDALLVRELDQLDVPRVRLLEIVREE